MSCGALARPSNDLHFQPQSWYKSSLFMEQDIDEWECLFWRGVYCKQSLGRQGIKDYREPRDCCSPIYLQMKMSSQNWKAAKQTDVQSTFFILPMKNDKAVAIHFVFLLTYFWVKQNIQGEELGGSLLTHGKLTGQWKAETDCWYITRTFDVVANAKSISTWAKAKWFPAHPVLTCIFCDRVMIRSHFTTLRNVIGSLQTHF